MLRRETKVFDSIIRAVRNTKNPKSSKFQTLIIDIWRMNAVSMMHHPSCRKAAVTQIPDYSHI